MKIPNLIYLQSFTLFPESFVSISIFYILIVMVLTTYNVYGLMLQKAISECMALVLLMSCYLIVNDDLMALDFLTFNNSIINDYFSVFTKMLLCFFSSVYFLIIADTLKEQKLTSFEYLLIMLFAIIGLMLLCSSNDLLITYLAIELSSLAFYILASFKKTSSYSVDAGIKYFIMGALSSAFFLLGSSLLYGFSGTINFSEFFVLCVTDEPLVLERGDIMHFFSYPLVFYYLWLVNYNWDTAFKILDIMPFVIDCQRVMGQKVYIPDYTETFKYLYQVKVNMKAQLDYSNLKAFSLLYENCMDSESTQKLWKIYKYYPDYYESAQKLKEIYKCKNNANAVAWVKLFWSCWLNTQLTALLNLYNVTSYYDCSFLGLGLTLILFSLFIKLALAPFHLWSLDIYEGSPTSSTVFFAVITKLSIFVILIRLCYTCFVSLSGSSWQFYSLWIGIFSVFVGSFAGLKQRKLKTLLAYSSTSHMGYSLIAFSTSTYIGVQMVLFYMIIYMISGLSIWSIFLLLKLKKNRAFAKYNKELGDFVLLKKSNPTMSFALLLTMFSIAGIPPMIGFIAKMNVFLSLVGSRFYFVALISILFSVISTFYYIRLIKILYFENLLVGKLYHPITTEKTIILSLLIFSLIFLFLNPTLLYLFSYKVILSLNIKNKVLL